MRPLMFRPASLIALTALALAGCQGPSPSAEEVSTGPERLVFVFQKQKDPRAIQGDAEEVAQMLSDELGIPVDVQIPTSYGATVQALVSNRAHVAYLSSIPFLLAHSETPMDLLLAEVRDGSTEYSSIFVVAADSPLATVADLRGKRMAFTSPTSTSGYVMPYARLVRDGLLEAEGDPKSFFGEVLFAGGYDQALLAVLNGQADVCAVSDYTMEGPKADVYLTAEQRARLRVLDRTRGVPTHLIAARADLPEDLRRRITQALLKMSETRPELLADVYGAASFAEVDDDAHVEGAKDALRRTGLGLRALVE